jgi:hypothetical protein
VALSAVAVWQERGGATRVDLSLTLSPTLGESHVQPQVSAQLVAAWQAVQKQARSAPELAAARQAYGRLRVVEERLALARAEVIRARGAVAAFIAGDGGADGDMFVLTRAVSMAEEKHAELETLREPLARTWRERRGLWDQAAARFAQAQGTRLYLDADQARKQFALDLSPEGLAALVHLVAAELVRGQAGTLRGDSLSRRIAADLDEPLAASEPLPGSELLEGPDKALPAWRCEFVPHDAQGLHVPFGPRQQSQPPQQPEQPNAIAAEKYKYTEYPEGQAPPKRANELPKR